MADALGGLAHGALTRRAWLLLPALLSWVMLTSSAFAYGPVHIIDGMAYGAFAAALGFVLRHASWTQGVVSTVLCVATFLSLPGLEVEGHGWEFLALLGLPAAVAALPRLRWGWLSLLLGSVGLVALLFASGGALTVEDGPTATRLPWVGAMLSVSAIHNSK